MGADVLMHEVVLARYQSLEKVKAHHAVFGSRKAARLLSGRALTFQIRTGEDLRLLSQRRDNLILRSFELEVSPAYQRSNVKLDFIDSDRGFLAVLSPDSRHIDVRQLAQCLHCDEIQRLLEIPQRF